MEYSRIESNLNKKIRKTDVILAQDDLLLLK
jgi:hypothetical protein